MNTQKKQPSLIRVWLDDVTDGRDGAAWIVSRDLSLERPGAPHTISIHRTHKAACRAAAKIDPNYRDDAEGDA